MGISLVKGQRFDIGIAKAEVGLGWEANISGRGDEFDLDASAFMLNANNKLDKEEYFIFYNNLSSPDGAVVSSGDEQEGGSEEGDDESLTVNLTKVNPGIKSPHCYCFFLDSIQYQFSLLHYHLYTFHLFL